MKKSISSFHITQRVYGLTGSTGTLGTFHMDPAIVLESGMAQTRNSFYKM